MNYADNIKVSIVVRSRNEEEWIGHCLTAVFAQSHGNFEVIIVDNDSSDTTLDIVNIFPVKQIVHLEKYLPGNAINEGIKQASGEVIVILSSHCVPKNKDWLVNLVNNFADKNVAGVYGRQLPVSYSSPSDVRDLFITFGLDKRVQVKDYFFHNANSAIRKSVWDRFPFDDDVTNIEDRIWGKKVTESGYQLVYEPMAGVYHHHGIHQEQNIKRINSTIKILKGVEKFDSRNWLPETLMPGNRNIVALVPVKEKFESIENIEPIQRVINELLAVKDVKKVYFISRKGLINASVLNDHVQLLERTNELSKDKVSLGCILKWGLEQVNQKGNYPDYIIYINPEYIFRPKNLLNILIHDACHKGLDTIFVGYTEYASYWSYDHDKDDYICVDKDLSSRLEKHPLYKSLFGLGCITKSSIIRNAEIVGKGRIGVIPTSDVKYTFRISDESMLPIMQSIIKDEM
jgi:rhamnosyltransferase